MSDLTPESLDALTTDLREYDMLGQGSALNHGCVDCSLSARVALEAADAITALRAEVERLTTERDEAYAEAQWQSGAMAAAEADAAAAREQVRKMREALTECADDLAAEIEARYPESTRSYPSEQRRYDRDMAPVLRARAALQGEG